MKTPSYLNGSNKKNSNLPSYLNTVRQSDNVGYDGLNAAQGLKETEANHLNEPTYISKAAASPQSSSGSKYTMDEWKNMNLFEKIKARIKAGREGNLNNLLPTQDFYNEEVNKRAKSPVGSFSSGLLNSASLGTLKVSADKQEADMKYNPGTNVFDESQKQSPISYKIGEFAGYALPGAAGTKLAKPVVKNIANPLLKRLAEGALVGGGMTAAQETFEGKPIEQIAKDTAINTVLGAGIDTGLYGISKAVKLPSYLNGLKLNTIENKFGKLPSIEHQIKNPSGTLKPILKTPSEPLQPNLKVDNLEVGKGTKQQTVNTMANQTIPITNSANEAADAINSNVDGGIKPRSFSETVANGEITSPELKSLIEKTDINYKPITNNDTLEFAKKAIENNYDDAISLVKSNSPATAESNAISQLLIKRLQDEGKYNDALDIIKITAEKATTQGQAIQALSMWGRLTPEGMLRHVQNTFNKVNNEIKIKGLKSKKIEITPELQKDVFYRMSKINQMPEGREKMLEVAKVLRDVDAQIPKEFVDKLSTYQTVAQLLNPKTIIRNVVGNTIFGGLENISNTIGAPIDAAISKLFRTQRTTLLPSLKTQLSAGLKGGKNALEESLQGVDLTRMGNKFELGHGKTFNKGIMSKLETATNIGLKVPDAAFYEAARADALRQMMKIASVSDPTPGMIEIADKLADYRTFQDSNGISRGLSNLKQSLNKLSSYFTGTDRYGLGDLVLRYTKTPANILARGIEYSPANVVNAMWKATAGLRGRTFDQKQFVDALARGMTGTGLIFAGYELNKLGIVTGAANKDYDVANLNRDIGAGEYRINTTALSRWIKSKNPNDAKPQRGDTFVSWDWAQPTSIVFAMGANIAQNKGDAADLVTTAADSIASGVNTILEQPLLTGLKKLTSGSNLAEAGMSTVLGMPNSLTPTFLKQIAQTTDNIRRNTYDPNKGKQAINLVKAKIPGLSTTLEPQVSTLGEIKKNYDSSGVKKGLDIFLNPAFSSKYNPTPATNLVLDIYNQSGDKTQFPRVMDKSFMYKGQKISLTPKELTALQEYVGKYTNAAFESKAKDKNFMDKAPEDKAKELQKILSKLYDEYKSRIVQARGLK